MKKTILSYLFCLSFFSFILAQESKVEFDGVVEFERARLPEANVNVYEKGSTSSVMNTASDDKGEFHLMLEYNKEYVVKIGKEGFVHKIIGLNTNMPEANSGKYGVGLTVELFTTCKKVDIGVMDNPVVKIAYNAQSNSFEPNNMYARDMSFKIMDLRQKIEECQKEDYNKLLDEADELMKEGKHEEAIDKYHEASLMHPSEKYPQKKIAQAKEVIKEEAKEEVQASANQLNQLIDEADSHLEKEEYSQAIEKYKKAQEIEPGDPYVNSRLSKAERLLEKEEQEQQLANLEAEQRAKELEEQKAKELAEKKALEEQRAKELAEQKAKELAEQKALEEKKAKELAEQKALEEQRAKELAEKKAREEALAKELAEKEAALEEAYKNALEDGNQFLAQKAFKEAKDAFNMARELKPEEQLPKDKIAEVNRLVAENLKREQEKLEKEKQYDDLITAADDLLANKQLKSAKTKYEAASLMEPDKEYPKEKIAEINRLLEQLAKEEKEMQEKMAKEKAYQELIQQADNSFNNKDYEQAKEKYKKAISLKPEDAHPKSRISEIEDVLAKKAFEEKKQQEQLAKEKACQELIDKANSSFEEGNYEQAKELFSQAITCKPEDTYPKTKIAEIDNILNDKEKDAKYKELVAQADKYASLNRIEDAKDFFKKALAVKPNEYYPKKRLKELDVQKKDQLVASATSTSKLEELSFKNDAERQAYLKKLALKYPEGITLEIYEEKFRTTERYIIVRDNMANEFRRVKESWGGTEYRKNDKPITFLYFREQTTKREGEYFKQVKK